VVADKTQNLRRLEAQRNELNAKGNAGYIEVFFLSLLALFFLSVLPLHLE
jgi:hypothetical protein